MYIYQKGVVVEIEFKSRLVSKNGSSDSNLVLPPAAKGYIYQKGNISQFDVYYLSIGHTASLVRPLQPLFLNSATAAGQM
jgi:hypothetical protein